MRPNPKAMLPSAAVMFMHRWAMQAPEANEGYVVELGSGHGSAALAMAICSLRLVSVEHDERFLGLVKTTRYIHAPIVNGWYNVDVLDWDLPLDEEIKAVVVDGPPGRIGRGGMIDHLDIFPRVPMLFDDVHRAEELELVRRVSERRNIPAVIHQCDGGRAFATLGF